jgi:hypothetical protein
MCALIKCCTGDPCKLLLFSLLQVVFQRSRPVPLADVICALLLQYPKLCMLVLASCYSADAMGDSDVLRAIGTRPLIAIGFQGVTTGKRPHAVVSSMIRHVVHDSYGHDLPALTLSMHDFCQQHNNMPWLVVKRFNC